MRVLYAHFAVFGQVHFFVGYGKNEQDDLTPDQEAARRTLMSEIHGLLSEQDERWSMKSRTNAKPKVSGKPSKVKATPGVGKRLISRLTDLRDALRSDVPLSERFTVRTARMPAAPSAYDAAAVRRTREKLGASQAVFAKLVGVSKVLEQSWEQGTRKPSKLACRILDEINRDVERWRRRIA